MGHHSRCLGCRPGRPWNQALPVQCSHSSPGAAASEGGGVMLELLGRWKWWLGVR